MRGMAGAEVAGRISANVLGAEPANNVQVKPHKYCLIDVCSTFYCIYGVFNERASWLQQGHKKGEGERRRRRRGSGGRGESTVQHFNFMPRWPNGYGHFDGPTRRIVSR